MGEKKKVFTNVLVSAGGNRLQLADVFFREGIELVEFRLPEPLSWEEVATPEKWQALQKRFKSAPIPPDYQPIEGNFFLLIPGTIDPHVHFDTPGFEFREDFEHASTAAAFGGVTTIADMPCTSLPQVTNRQNLNTKLAALQGRSVIDYAFWGGISGTDFSDESKLR